MIVLVTKRLRERTFDPLYFLSTLKYLLKSKIQGVRGPQQVINNLTKGLDSLGMPYIINPHLKDIANTSIIGVLRDAHALQQIINLKKSGVNLKIIAGPNIIVTPKDFHGIILDPVIDKIITPSQWVKDFYMTFSNKITIATWAVGVPIPSKSSSQDGPIIIYKKKVPESIFNHIIETLHMRNMKYVVLEYGHFHHSVFSEFLSHAPLLIYLQEIESQGIALFETWSYNVPTLIWENKKYTYPNTNLYVQGNIAAPYLTPETGQYFDRDFEHKLTSMLTNIAEFTPRRYIERNFSLERSAEEYLNILHE